MAILVKLIIPGAGVERLKPVRRVKSYASVSELTFRVMRMCPGVNLVTFDVTFINILELTRGGGSEVNVDTLAEVVALVTAVVVCVVTVTGRRVVRRVTAP